MPTPVSRGAINDASNADSYSFSSFTPGGHAVIAVGINVTGTNPVATISDDSGGVLVWTEQFGSDGAGNSTHLWTTVAPAAPSAVVITVSFAGATGAEGEAFEVPGGTCRQAKSAAGAAVATPAVTLDAAFLTTSAGIAWFFNATNPAGVTEPAGWTETTDVGHAAPTRGLETATRVSGETNSTITWQTNSASTWRVIVLEVAENLARTLALMGVGR